MSTRQKYTDARLREAAILDLQESIKYLNKSLADVVGKLQAGLPITEDQQKRVSDMTELVNFSLDTLLGKRDPLTKQDTETVQELVDELVRDLEEDGDLPRRVHQALGERRQFTAGWVERVTTVERRSVTVSIPAILVADDDLKLRLEEELEEARGRLAQKPEALEEESDEEDNEFWLGPAYEG